MSIDIELALVLGLFIIGAVVLAVDNLVDALYRRASRWLRIRKSVRNVSRPDNPAQKKRLEL